MEQAAGTAYSSVGTSGHRLQSRKEYYGSAYPGQSLIAPAGATHYEVILAAAAIDFDCNAIQPAQTGTGWRPLANGTIEQQFLKPDLPAHSNNWLFGIEQGGMIVPLKDKHYQAFGMQVVELIPAQVA